MKILKTTGFRYRNFDTKIFFGKFISYHRYEMSNLTVLVIILTSFNYV